MSAKITAICYIHETNECLTQKYTVRKITAISRLDAKDPIKIVYLKVHTFWSQY
jgi:hypothetical protein